jgi:dihydrofolate reductase
VKVSYYVACTLDGYIADSDGGVDWLGPFMASGEDFGYSEFIASVDALVMGRRTYDTVRAFGAWPYGDLPCLVLTHRQLEPATPTIRACSGEPSAVVDRLRGEGLEHAWLVGGASVAGEFFRTGLVDDLIITLVPIFLGRGIPLLADTAEPSRKLHLVETTRWANDLVTLHYRLPHGHESS